MIYDKLSHLETYFGLSDRLDRALSALRDTDFSALENGKHCIDGDNLFMNISSYVTRTANEHPEAHEKYIDIQYLISGEENVGVAPIDTMESVFSSDPDNDCALYNGKTAGLKLGGDAFLVLFPQDAHAPGIACGEPAEVRKVVFKVLL